MKITRRSDWKTELMPSEREHVLVQRVYSADEFARLKLGLLPEVMEDRWFIYYEEPWLFIHRSWTGHCIFHVRFEQVGDEFVVAEAIRNRNPEQCAGSGGDTAILSGLLDRQAKR